MHNLSVAFSIVILILLILIIVLKTFLDVEKTLHKSRSDIYDTNRCQKKNAWMKFLFKKNTCINNFDSNFFSIFDSNFYTLIVKIFWTHFWCAKSPFLWIKHEILIVILEFKFTFKFGTGRQMRQTIYFSTSSERLSLFSVWSIIWIPKLKVNYFTLMGKFAQDWTYCRPFVRKRSKKILICYFIYFS